MIIKNNILPPKGFKAIAIFPFIFVRIGETMSDIDLNHEKIHLNQQKKVMIIFVILLIPVIWYFSLTWWSILFSYLPFYVLYGIFHLIYGYRKNPFEKEAYDNENNLEYLKNKWLNSI